MRYFLMLSSFIVLSCASFSGNSRGDSFQFEHLSKLNIGITTEQDVIGLFGSPTSMEEKQGYYTFTYIDSKTAFQRVTLNFASETHKLSGFVWLPKQGEKETSLEDVKQSFRNSHFEERRVFGKNPHMILEVVSYVDNKSGITIKLNSDGKSVEAIAMYDVGNRLPTSDNKNEQIPYTFGDELKASK
ncbi:MAG: hypothetical protein JSU04_00420 [Bdellovibrionales bacterium]|nr:hypothetical protein [Bdellovibrionales bacterium]